MTAPFARRSPGSPVVHHAGEVNAWNEVALAYRRNALSNNPDLGELLPPGVILIRNDTGSAVNEYRALALGAALFAASELGFETPAFTGLAPAPETNPAHRSRVAITLEPIANGAIGRAMIAGQIAAPVDVIQIAHTRARVLPDGTLQSGYVGPVRILAASAASTTARCRLSIDHHDGGHLWAKVPEAGIGSGTFAAPSTTSCVLAWPDPSTGAITDVPGDRTHRTVNVIHYGDEIEPATGKYVQCRIIAGRIVPDVEYC